MSNSNLLHPPGSPSASAGGFPRSRPVSTSGDSSSNVSLTVNYLPSKFATGLLSPGGTGARRRPAKAPGYGFTGIPKQGGGVDAFSKTGGGRIGGAGGYEDDDDDPAWLAKRQGSAKRKKGSWTRFKWILFFTNTLLTIYSVCSLIFCLLTWFNIWTHADIVRVGNVPELTISTLAACLGILTALVGWAGILLNNRPFLAVYCLLTWITFAFLVVPGYITYRKRAFNLEGKLNAQWSRDLGISGRLRIQNQLGCCGWFSPFIEATVSSTCYARSVLPGCKREYLNWQRFVLGRWFTVAFAIAGTHLFVMITALLCSNHVTYRFGKGMMPKRYRLSVGSMAVIMEQYANQLSDQYGPDVATDIMNRSKSNLALQQNPSSGSGSSTGTAVEKSMISGPTPVPSGTYGAGRSSQEMDLGDGEGYAMTDTGMVKHGKYDSLSQGQNKGAAPLAF